MSAWQFNKALYNSKLHGWTQFVSMQSHLNLLYREEEREMLPLCADQGIAVMPWSPLARGRLARPWNENTELTRYPAINALDWSSVSAVQSISLKLQTN